MPGDEWQKFANLRMFYAWMYGQPGKKLLFMGGEFGQWREWNHDQGLDWHLLEGSRHDGLRRLVQHFNSLYKNEPALWEQDDTYEGFEWIDFHDADNSVVSFLRRSREGDTVVFIVNATPVVRVRLSARRSRSRLLSRDHQHRRARPTAAATLEISAGLQAEAVEWQGRTYSIPVNLPPLAVVAFKCEAMKSEASGGSEAAGASKSAGAAALETTGLQTAAPEADESSGTAEAPDRLA